MAKNGKWESYELSEGFLPAPILTFVVKNCQITQVEIWVFPARGELFWTQIAGPITLQDNGFSYTGTDAFGAITLEGTFESGSKSSGTLFFPKGFLVVDYTLPEDVTISWSAHP